MANYLEAAEHLSPMDTFRISDVLRQNALGSEFSFTPESDYGSCPITTTPMDGTESLHIQVHDSSPQKLLRLPIPLDRRKKYPNYILRNEVTQSSSKLMPPNATEEDLIEQKRLQDTLAARRS